MCFNLFFPFIAESKKYMQKLGDVFGIIGVVQNAQFEVVLNAIEFTNFDFCIVTGSKHLFELKLTENSFGATKADEAHLYKFANLYLPVMDGKFKPQFCSSDVFLRHYQIMRSVWNLETSNSDRLIVLVPRANTCLKKELAFLDACVTEVYRKRVSVVFLEDVVDSNGAHCRFFTENDEALSAVPARVHPALRKLSLLAGVACGGIDDQIVLRLFCVSNPGHSR